MYPITIIPLWMSIVGVIAAIGFSCWVADEDDSPRSIGHGAVFISFITAGCWFGSLPWWTAAVIIMVTLALFVAGMIAPDTIDVRLHYGAMIVAVFGKLAIAAVPFTWAVLTGTVTVPVIVLIAMALFAVGSLVAWRRSKSLRQRLISRTQADQPK